MKNFLLLILNIGIICLLPSCKGPCKGFGGYVCQISGELKKYSFKPNSYWVYQDSATGIIDSQEVVSYSAQNNVYFTSTLGNLGADCADYGDGFSMTEASYVNGVFKDSVYIHSLDCGAIYATDTFAMYYSYALNGYPTDTLLNYTVLNNTFSKVLRYSSYNNSWVYHADNIGVVKCTFNDSIRGQRTWNLLRYHVVNP